MITVKVEGELPPILEGQGVTKYFGGLAALKDVDFTLEAGEILGVIGPNGAGKTTLINCISGVYRLDAGRLRFKGQDICDCSQDERCKRGIARTFQIVRPFLNLTAVENVMIGVLYGRGGSEDLNDAHREALHFLELVGLKGQRDVPAKNLTAHKRKMLELARALATDPSILLMDEVAAGLNPSEVLEAMQMVRKIHHDLDISILWIEHVMKAIMGVAERIIVLNYGEKIAEGKPDEIANDPRVIKAYLGEKHW
jgi:branched-chain amino acid transport system ATP-binding protein